MRYYQRFYDEKENKEKEILIEPKGEIIDFNELLKIAESNVNRGKAPKYYYIIEKSIWTGENILFDNRQKEGKLEEISKK